MGDHFAESQLSISPEVIIIDNMPLGSAGGGSQDARFDGQRIEKLAPEFDFMDDKA